MCEEVRFVTSSCVRQSSGLNKAFVVVGFGGQYNRSNADGIKVMVLAGINVTRLDTCRYTEGLISPDFELHGSQSANVQSTY